jgi:hypothetical protein
MMVRQERVPGRTQLRHVERMACVECGWHERERVPRKKAPSGEAGREGSGETEKPLAAKDRSAPELWKPFTVIRGGKA